MLSKQDPLPCPQEFSHPVESLALTVEEVVDVRRVLVKAEMEKFLQDKELFSSLKRGKVRLGGAGQQGRGVVSNRGWDQGLGLTQWLGRSPEASAPGDWTWTPVAFHCHALTLSLPADLLLLPNQVSPIFLATYLSVLQEVSLDQQTD